MKHELRQDRARHLVSPTTIRSRILKGHVSQTAENIDRCFTHNDPFEDTESTGTLSTTPVYVNVSPTTIRSRILKEADCDKIVADIAGFHPQRSVRGY